MEYNLKNTVLTAAVEAAHKSLVEEVEFPLFSVPECSRPEVEGKVQIGSGFSTIDFSKVKFKFTWSGRKGVMEMSANGGQFYVTVNGLMDRETCQGIDSMVKKLRKLSNRTK